MEEKKELMEKKKNVFILFFVLLLILIFIVLFLYSKVEKEEKKDPIDLDQDPVVEESESNTKILEKYRLLNIFNTYGNMEYGFFYKQDHLTKDQIPDSVKIVVALHKILNSYDLSSPITIQKSLVEKEVYDFFNTEVTHQNVEVYGYSFVFENDQYVKKEAKPSDTSKRIATRLSKIYEKDSVYYIEEKVAYLVYKNDTYYLYDHLDEEESHFIDTVSLKNFDEFNLLDYQDQLPTYQIQYKKITDNKYMFSEINRLS